MGNTVELLFDRVIKFFLAMAVDIAPERRNTVQVLSPLDIYQLMTVGPADDAWLFAQPFLHLRERVPEITMVDLLQLVVRARHVSCFTCLNASIAFSICAS